MAISLLTNISRKEASSHMEVREFVKIISYKTVSSRLIPII